MLTIAYFNFWPICADYSIQDLWFFNFIKQNIDNDAKLVDYNTNPDILICSCFGNINNVANIQAKIKFFFYGENLDRYPPYNNIDLLKNTFDLIVGFKYTDLKNKIVRIPLWLTYYNYYNYVEDDNILKYIQNSYNNNIQKPKKNASLVASHPGFNNVRQIIHDNMKSKTLILCPGRFKRNVANIGLRCEDKINFIKKTVFNICPENSAFEGYYTEKIFHALEAGCIPIYWAINKPEFDIINENCYCFVNLENTTEIVNKINHVTTNPREYIQENIFKPNAGNVINNYYKTLKNEINILLNQRLQ